jgi:hypothetical protein
MNHQLDHATVDGSACVGYIDKRDTLTSHRRFINCPACKTWLKNPLNLAQAEALELRVTGRNEE